ncbi:MAG: stage III sporulation protein AA [Tissierellia bacterium]|nr:stage III sporulation protein AA [Tissierellia bacterium]
MKSDDINIYNKVLEYICLELSHSLGVIDNEYKKSIEEIRLRVGMPLNVYLKGEDYFVSPNGRLNKGERDGILVQSNHIYKTFQLISNYSIYAFQEEIRNGFITLKGGHRVGVGGKVLYGNNGIETIKNISSLNIRIAREKIGVSNNILPYILDFHNSIYNTLIISPPQCGKTTLLRDIIRNLSNGDLPKRRGFKIAIIDERSELSGMYNGVPQHNIGIRTDVLDGCNKKDGTTILIRAMSPDIIAMDEIGGIGDVEAIHESLKAGIRVIATVHGNSLEDLLSKRSLRILIEERVFDRYIFLDNSMGVGTVKEILQGKDFKPIRK